MAAKVRNLRWWIAALLFLSTFINYVDRQTLSVLAPVIQTELGISEIQYANILTGFLASYTVMYLGSGLLVDRWGARLALSVFIVWWSLANMSHAFVIGAFSLGVMRFLLGMGESGNFMAAFRAVSEWYPARERALVHGLIQGGAAIGAIVAPPLITAVLSSYGWRAAFIITGAMGFVWLAFWLLLYHPPGNHPHITDEERALLCTGAAGAQNNSETSAKWSTLLRHPQIWGLLVSRFLSDPVWWFYLFWLPKYLVNQRGFTMADVGKLAWIPYLAADLGAVFGGWLSGRLIASGKPVLRARLMVMLPLALLMPASLAIHRIESRNITLALICVVMFAHMAWKTNQNTLTNDIFPKRLIGATSGLLAFGTGLGGTLFTWLTGHVVASFGYGAIFVVMGVLHPISFLITRHFVRATFLDEAAPQPASI
jgi:ACS family hexuronate transporter-like MFS transporter